MVLWLNAETKSAVSSVIMSGLFNSSEKDEDRHTVED